MYTARRQGDLIFLSRKDERGLYYLLVEFLPISQCLEDVTALADGGGGGASDTIEGIQSNFGVEGIRRKQGTPALSRLYQDGVDGEAAERPTLAYVSPTRAYSSTCTHQNIHSNPRYANLDRDGASIEAAFVCSGGGQHVFSAVDLVVLTTATVEEAGLPTWGWTDFSFLARDSSTEADQHLPPCYFAGPCDCPTIGGRDSARILLVNGGPWSK